MAPGGIVGDLPKAGSHRPRGIPRASRRARWRLASLLGVHALFLAHLAHYKLAGSSVSPLEPSEAMQTLELGYVNAGFVLLALSVGATLVLGRFFCGWACHVVALQDGCAWLLGRVGLRPRPVRSRLLAFVPLGAAFYMFAWPTLSGWLQGRVSPAWRAHFLTEDFWATFPGPWISLLTFAVCGGLIVWLMGAKGFCTYGCPYGALFGLADRAAPGRIRVTDACEGCGHCTATCTSNVQVHREVAQFGMVVDAGCMKCMDCVSVCPKDALYYGFRPKTKKRAQRPASVRAYDFTWPEELALAAVFGLSFYAWRGLYERVPFLLALGLSVVTALAAAVAWRLVTRAEVAFQGRALRKGRRWTGAGATAAALCSGLLVLASHSFLVQVHAKEGRRQLLAAGELPAELRGGLLADSLEDLLAAERLGLAEVGELHLQIGSILREQGERAQAEQRFQRAIEVQPRLTAPRLALADLLIARQARTEAEQVLEGLLARDPRHKGALQRLAMLLLERGDAQRAEQVLRTLLSVDPTDVGALRRLESLRTIPAH